MTHVPGASARPAQTTSAESAPDQLDRMSADGGRLIVARLLQFGMLFGFNVIAARALGPAGRGDYIVPATLATVVGIATHLSLESGLGRMLARREVMPSQAAGLCITGTLFVSALGLIVYAAIISVLRSALSNSVSSTSLVLAGATIPFISSAFILATLLLRIGGTRDYGFTMAMGAALQVAALIGLWTFRTLTPEIALAVILLANSMITVGLFVALGRRMSWRTLVPAPPGALGLQALNLSIRVHPATVAIFMVMRLDVLIVGFLAGSGATGRYSISKSVAEVAYLAAGSLALAALHGQTHADEDIALSHTVEQTRLSVLIALLLALLLAACAYPLILVLYGEAWIAAVVPLMLLAVGGVALAIEGPVRGLLIRIAPLPLISCAALFALALSVALDFALIPKFGIIGAALASVVSYAAAATAMLLILRRETGTPLYAVLRPPKIEALRTLAGRNSRAGGQRGETRANTRSSRDERRSVP